MKRNRELANDGRRTALLHILNWRASLLVAVVALLGLAAAGWAAVSHSSTYKGSVPSYAHDIPIPPGTQIGTGSITATCSATIDGAPLGSGSALARITGALPTIVHPGQSLWVTGIVGETIVPAQTSDQLYALGARKVKVNILSSITNLAGAANSSADLVNSNHIDIPEITLVQGQPIVVNIAQPKPLQLGPLATKGPGVAYLENGSSSSQLIAYNSLGIQIFTVQTTCPTPNPPEITAMIDVAGKPASGSVRVGSYPERPVPDNSLVGSTGFAYRCRIPGMGAFRLAGSGTQYGSFGPSGLVFHSGQKLPFLYTQGDQTLGASAVARLIRLIHREPHGRRATRIRFILEHVHETATHLLPAHSSLPGPVTGSTLPLVLGKPLRFTEPASGRVANPFIMTAGTPGIANSWLSDEAFRLQPLTSSGHRVGKPLKATCPAPKPRVPIFPAVIEK